MVRLFWFHSTRFLLAVLAGSFVGVAGVSAASYSGDPCEEIGADCRVMAAAETHGFANHLASLRKVLPIPDPARFTQSSLEAFVEGMTAPAKAALSGPGSQPPVMTCRSWPLGCFPESGERQVIFRYSRKEERAKTDQEADDLLSLARGIADETTGQIQISAEEDITRAHWC